MTHAKCARTVCQDAGVHPHRDNHRYYCTACATAINEHAMTAHGQELFPTLNPKVIAVEQAIRALTPEHFEAVRDRLGLCPHCWLFDRPQCQCWNDE